MKPKALIVLMALCLVGSAVMQAAPSLAADFTLTYSNFFPPTHTQSILAEAWCREVEKRTDGRVAIQYFPGQTLTKGNVCYDGVVSGISDLGLSVLAYTRGRFPVMEVVDLPLGYPNGQVATQVVNEVYAKLQPTELSDTQVMYLHAHGPGLLHTKKNAVRKLEDLKGLKIRSTGTSAAVVQALGGTPVAQPMPETYQLLEKGTVDGSVHPVESNQGWKLGEVVDFATLSYPAAYTTSFFVVMNKTKWAALPEDIQKIIAEINQEWIAKSGQAWDEADQVGWKFMKEKGVELIELDEAESKRWAEAVRPVLDEFVSKTTAKGLPGAEALKTAQEAVTKFSQAK
jgi:TRAP-type C4-dicarboxylate transport system substrate-binding protein